MAWIKMRVELRDDPNVISMGSRLDVKCDMVVGKLHRFWSWIDTHCRAGKVPMVGHSADQLRKYLDQLCDQNGFASALENVKWLRLRDGEIIIPNWKRHLSQCAKKRATDAKRAKKSRAKASRSRHAKSAPTRCAQSALDKMRLDKSNTPLPPAGDDVETQRAKQAEEIWEIWKPKKKAVKAKAAIAKALGKVEYAKLRAAVVAYMAGQYVQSRLGTENEGYIPLCATWMNGEEWNNEVAESPVERRKRQDAAIANRQARDHATEQAVRRKGQAEDAARLKRIAELSDENFDRLRQQALEAKKHSSILYGPLSRQPARENGMLAIDICNLLEAEAGP